MPGEQDEQDEPYDPDGSENGLDDGVDDLEQVFALGRRPSHDPTPDDEQRHRRTKRFALWALAVVVAVVVAAIALVSLLVDTSGPPTSPSAAAQRWALDLVHGDTSARKALECPAGAQDADQYALILTAASGARAGHAVLRGTAAWRVPLRFLGPSGATQASVTVEVIRRGGRFLVC